MSMTSSIEWTDMTWNPVVGCTRVSAGCDNCYAIRQVHRLGANPHPKVKAVNEGLTRWKGGALSGFLDWSGEVRCLPERLELPLRLKKPHRIFVNSLADLFHEQVPDEFIFQVLDTIRQCFVGPAPKFHSLGHIFQILTKRADRMADFCDRVRFDTRQSGRWYMAERGADLQHRIIHILKNIHWGVSVEDQKTADERIPFLLQTPAAVRFLSCEPLLGPIQFSDPRRWFPTHEAFAPPPKIDWMIVGGESGPNARVWDGFTDAARSLRDQCRAAGVAFFMKQMAGVRRASMPTIPDDLMVREFPHAT